MELGNNKINFDENQKLLGDELELLLKYHLY